MDQSKVNPNLSAMLNSLLLPGELPSPEAQPRPESFEKTLATENFLAFDPLPPVLSQGLRTKSTSAPPMTSLPAHYSSLVPSIVALSGRILHELETNLPRLLSLNPSRREAVAQHLDRLAGQTSGPSALTGNADPASGLRRWVEGPRTPSQNSAIQTYFEEIALVNLGQAILLKAWSDRDIRPLSESDLGRLNWALSTALKPHLPLDREGWQITRPNLYSWYNPSAAIQREIWNTMESWRITDEGPAFLISLLAPARQAHPEAPIPQGYDPRFFKCIWESIGTFGFKMDSENSPLKRARISFSPTLRDGSLIRTGPIGLNWIGMEASPYQLLLAELVKLWWGPSAPPFWAMGSGLEVHTKEQMALALGSPKPSLLSRITEMEACDLSFVLEEYTVRAQGRSSEAHRFREQLEILPYFKKLRAPGTTLGALQACVALSKLRPGGLLIWAREEPLTRSEGPEVLNFFLERAKILCEWDLSELDHSLPATIPLFSKYLYVFIRSPELETRLTHRPLRIRLQGHIRSHVELPLVLEDAIQCAFRTVQPRGQWSIQTHRSPTAQKEWAERWPDPACQNSIRTLESLRTHSLPLAHVGTVRHTPDGDPEKDHSWTIGVSFRGFWITAVQQGDSRRLAAYPLPAPGKEAKGNGFIILVSDDTWTAPLVQYLQSDLVQAWIEHHAERKSGKWVLDEQLIKWLPIPKVLLRTLGVPAAIEPGISKKPMEGLGGEWDKLVSEIAFQPKVVRQALDRLPPDEHGNEIRAAIFVKASQVVDHLKTSQNHLLSLVTSDGRIRWRELVEILPKHECVPLPFHPKIKMTGNMPPHFPIGRIEKARNALPGIALITENGFYLHIGTETQMIVDIIWEQVQGLTHPTWNELLRYIKVPRRTELAEATASDVLKSHGEHSARLRDLSELISLCKFF